MEAESGDDPTEHEPRDCRIPRKPVVPYTPVSQDDSTTTTRTTPVPPALQWRPIYLHRRILAIFSGLYLVLIVGIETLYQFSERNHGLAASVHSRRYLWTYGPTAVFTLILAFWSRIVYHSRASAPWARMAQGPTPAPRSILLDYLSGFDLTVPWKAIRNQDYLIAAATVGAWVLRLIMVVSTSLMVLMIAQAKTKTIPLTLRDSFTSPSDSPQALGQSSTLPVYTLEGIKTEGLGYPEGTTPELSYQTFQSPAVPRDSILSTEVDAFIADLGKCEPAELVVKYWGTRLSETDNGRVDEWMSDISWFSSNCHVYNADMTGSADVGLAPSWEWAGFQQVNCHSGNRTKILLGAASVSTTRTRVPGRDAYGETLYDYNATVSKYTGLICSPIYDIVKVSLSTNLTSSTSTTYPNITLSPDPQNRTLPHIDGDHISRTLFAMLANADGQDPTGVLETYSPPASLDFINDGAILLALNFQRSVPEFDQLFDAHFLREIVNPWYRAMTAQIAQQFYKTDQPTPSTGSVLVEENRLIVRKIPVRLLEGFLALMVFLAVLMILTTQKYPFAPRNPTAITSMAIFLSRSRELSSLFRATGQHDIQVLEDRTKHHSFHSGVSGSGQFIIRCEQTQPGKRSGSPLAQTLAPGPVNWWQPFSVRTRVCISVAVVLALLIAGLEVALRHSRSHEGFSDVTPDGYAQYVSLYIPAAIMVGIGLYFGALDFAIRCTAPFSRLNEGTTIERSIQLNLLDQMAPGVAITAIRTKNWAALLVSLATILAPFLTIITSGVFIATNVPLPTPIQLQRDTVFNLSIRPDVYWGKEKLSYAVLTTGLILYDNLSFPAWTYRDPAFDNLSVIASSAPLHDRQAYLRQGTIKTMAPALRSVRKCTVREVYPSLSWNRAEYVQAFNSTPGSDWVYPVLSFLFPPTEGCPLYYDTDGNPLVYDLPTITDNSTFSYLFDQTSTDQYLVRPCSENIYAWGRMQNSQLKHFRFVGCNETVQEIDVDLSLTLPSLQIDPSDPPQADESTVRNSSMLLPEAWWDEFPNVTVDHLETLFSALVNSGQITLSDLSSAEGDKTVMRAVEQTHNLIRAQQFDAFARLTVTSRNMTTVDPIPAMAVYPNRLRIVQDVTSTRVLQAFLASLLLCSIGTRLLIKTNKIVPKNPCSPAATMSLMAESNLLDDGLLPAGAEWMTDKQIQGTCGWEQWKVRMGWFEDVDVQDQDQDQDQQPSPEEDLESSPTRQPFLHRSPRFTIYLTEEASCS